MGSTDLLTDLPWYQHHPNSLSFPCHYLHIPCLFSFRHILWGQLLSIDLPCLWQIIHHFSLIVSCNFQLYILSHSSLFWIFILGVILVVNFGCEFTIDGVTIFISYYVYSCAISYVTSFNVLFFLCFTIITFVSD